MLIILMSPDVPVIYEQCMAGTTCPQPCTPHMRTLTGMSTPRNIRFFGLSLARSYFIFIWNNMHKKNVVMTTHDERCSWAFNN